MLATNTWSPATCYMLLYHGGGAGRIMRPHSDGSHCAVAMWRTTTRSSTAATCWPSRDRATWATTRLPPGRRAARRRPPRSQVTWEVGVVQKMRQSGATVQSSVVAAIASLGDEVGPGDAAKWGTPSVRAPVTWWLPRRRATRRSGGHRAVRRRGDDHHAVT